MDESSRNSPVLTLILTCIFVAASIYFASHYEVIGLDGVTFRPKQPSAETRDNNDDTTFVGSSLDYAVPLLTETNYSDTLYSTPSKFASSLFQSKGSSDAKASETTSRRVRNLRIASWALAGFGPTKLQNETSRRNLVRVVRKFDIVCFQQINAIERDVVPRIVDAINEGGNAFDFVLGQPAGTGDQSEQLAIVFNTDRVNVDRSQSYTVADPQNQMTYDPMVAWFRTAIPSVGSAWTFTVVNVRINLARAPIEVGLLPAILDSVRNDGRGEDDIVMAGLFQADDSYLVKRTMPENVVAAVRSAPTDIFGRHQTCNILVDRSVTTEYLGRGGPVDFLRLYNLSIAEAESVSSHLPIFAEFTATEGGEL